MIIQYLVFKLNIIQIPVMTKAILHRQPIWNIHKKSMDDCFYITNICPQLHAFNAGIWEDLEKKVRDWAVKYDSLIVISAPILETCTKKGNLTVPTQFYKIIYSIKQNTATAFLMDANLTEGSIFNYQTSVSRIDSLTKLNYFNIDEFSNGLNPIDSVFWKY